MLRYRIKIESAKGWEEKVRYTPQYKRNFFSSWKDFKTEGLFTSVIYFTTEQEAKKFIETKRVKVLDKIYL